MIFENIEELAQENNNFRKVIYTGNHSQLVLMSLLALEDIGSEVHASNDQILFIVAGQGEAVLNDKVTKIMRNSVVYVPSDTKHNIKNTGPGTMKLYTLYAPAAHADKTVHKTKADAQKEEHHPTSPENPRL